MSMRRAWLYIAIIAAAVIAGGFIDGSTARGDIDGRQCFEDEAVVMLLETWTGTHHERASATGDIYCVPWDDMRQVFEVHTEIGTALVVYAPSTEYVLPAPSLPQPE